MSTNFEPDDDPCIPCEVRLWQGKSIVVFVHPREWKQVSFGGLCPMLVTCLGVTFQCDIASYGESYRSGVPKAISPHAFGVPTHGDYPGTARIDWATAIPDVLRQSLEESEAVQKAWQQLTTSERLAHLRVIYRAQKPSSRVDRQLQVIRTLTNTL